MKIFKNRKKENELLGKALGAAVKEALELKAENRKLRDECAEQEKRIQMLEGAHKSRDAALEERLEEIAKLKAELKVRSGEVVTMKDLVERQGEDLQAARDTLRRVKNVLR